MSNTHAIADTAYELQATCEDLLPACVISTTFPAVPVSSMTLAAFATQAYVRDGQALVYCDQPAITLTLSGSAGTYWLAISRDVSTAYATWTRRAGSHYLWQLAGARPPDVDGVLVFSSVTVAGGVITAVTPAPGVTRAERWRTLAGLGTMATQNANAVAITGGNAVVASLGVGTTPIVPLDVSGDGRITRLGVGRVPVAGYDLATVGDVLVGTHLGISSTTQANIRVMIAFDKSSRYGIKLLATGTDTGPGQPIVFANTADVSVGSISTTGSATAYNTTSDARLKEFIQTLVGALDVVRALRPVSFHWQADGSRGNGFLAHELMQVIPEAVSGLPDEVNLDGSVKPQQVDHSKLVPWLTACCQELAAQVQALSARLQTLEEQLGI